MPPLVPFFTSFLDNIYLTLALEVFPKSPPKVSLQDDDNPNKNNPRNISLLKIL